MSFILLVISAIIFICVFLNKFSSKVGIPVLLLFILLGMAFGWNQELDTQTDRLIGDVCSFALIFIMFYGGFGTRWKSARPVALEAGLLASVGVLLTAGLTGVFCHFALGWGWIESMLMGSVVSSTDAATVFSILRTRNLGLKNNSAPMLEIESGSNDPCSYMLTAIMLSVLSGNSSGWQVGWMVFAQLAFGAGCGLGIAKGAAYLLKRFRFSAGGFDSMFIFAVAILSYALPSTIGGNGYLSAYIVGIVLGNTDFHGRKPLVGFFDGVTSLMQILIFFLLGIMVMPGDLLAAVVPALMIFAFMLLVARPAAVSAILLPFKKYGANQIGLISFVGLRGAASIVFAIMTITSGAGVENDIFSIVFCIVLISIAFQGSLIPRAAERFKMVDKDADSRKTFSDFSESADMSFGCVEIREESNWNGVAVKDLLLPQDMILTLILRGNDHLVPKGNTVIRSGDKVIFCVKSYQDNTEPNLTEHPLSSNSQWIGKKVRDYPYRDGSLLVMIRRGDERIIPNGNTVLQKDDVLVILKLDPAQANHRTSL